MNKTPIERQGCHMAVDECHYEELQRHAVGKPSGVAKVTRSDPL